MEEAIGFFRDQSFKKNGFASSRFKQIQAACNAGFVARSHLLPDLGPQSTGPDPGGGNEDEGATSPCPGRGLFLFFCHNVGKKTKKKMVRHGKIISKDISKKLTWRWPPHSWPNRSPSLEANPCWGSTLNSDTLDTLVLLSQFEIPAISDKAVLGSWRATSPWNESSCPLKSSGIPCPSIPGRRVGAEVFARDPGSTDLEPGRPKLCLKMTSQMPNHQVKGKLGNTASCLRSLRYLHKLKGHHSGPCPQVTVHLQSLAHYLRLWRDPRPFCSTFAWDRPPFPGSRDLKNLTQCSNGDGEFNQV